MVAIEQYPGYGYMLGRLTLLKGQLAVMSEYLFNYNF